MHVNGSTTATATGTAGPGVSERITCQNTTGSAQTITVKVSGVSGGSSATAHKLTLSRW